MAGVATRLGVWAGVGSFSSATAGGFGGAVAKKFSLDLEARISFSVYARFFPKFSLFFFILNFIIIFDWCIRVVTVDGYQLDSPWCSFGCGVNSIIINIIIFIIASKHKSLLLMIEVIIHTESETEVDGFCQRRTLRWSLHASHEVYIFGWIILVWSKYLSLFLIFTFNF